MYPQNPYIEVTLPSVEESESEKLLNRIEHLSDRIETYEASLGFLNAEYQVLEENYARIERTYLILEQKYDSLHANYLAIHAGSPIIRQHTEDPQCESSDRRTAQEGSSAPPLPPRSNQHYLSLAQFRNQLRGFGKQLREEETTPFREVVWARDVDQGHHTATSGKEDQQKAGRMPAHDSDEEIDPLTPTGPKNRAEG
jgi:hypothetical protein